MKRPTKIEYGMILAMTAALRASCPRRKVGCIFVDERDHVLSTGYNGPPAGMVNCTDVACAGACSKSGEGLNLCQAIHAEANALLQCRDVQQIKTAFVTAAPCWECTKMLLNTSCKRIVYLQPYPHEQANKMWRGAGRELVSVFDLVGEDSIIHQIAELYGFSI